MNYNIIPILGVSAFLYPVIYYKSYRSFIIFLNGILYHGTNNSIFKYNAVITNIILISYTSYLYKSSRLLGMLGSFMYISNVYLCNKNLLNKNQGEIFHVLGTQWILLIGLLNSLKEKNMIHSHLALKSF